MIITDEQFNAIIYIFNHHLNSYYPNDMLLVENYYNNTVFTYFDLFRAHITKGDGYTRIENKRRIIECSNSVIYLRSIRNKRMIRNQLKLLGLEVF